MHGGKTWSCDFITRRETELYARTPTGTPTFIHINITGTHATYFTATFQPDLFQVLSRFTCPYPYRRPTAASEFELRKHTAPYWSAVYFIYLTMTLNRWLRLRRSVKISRLYIYPISASILTLLSSDFYLDIH